MGSDRAGQVPVDISSVSATVLSFKTPFDCLLRVIELVDVRATIPGPRASAPRHTFCHCDIAFWSLHVRDSYLVYFTPKKYKCIAREECFYMKLLTLHLTKLTRPDQNDNSKGPSGGVCIDRD